MIFWIVYLGATFATSILIMRVAARHVSYCHGESKGSISYTWDDRHLCNRHCNPGCWRTDNYVNLSAALCGFSAFLWPIILIPGAAWMLANRKPISPKHLDLDARLAALEKQNDVLERTNKLGPYSES